MGNYVKCYYCGDNMMLVAIQVKRPPPPGAKDLGLYDEQYVFECHRCKNSMASSYLVRKCDICEGMAIVPDMRDSAPNFPIVFGPFPDKSGICPICSNCVSSMLCQECRQPPKQHELNEFLITENPDIGRIGYHHKCYEEYRKRIKKDKGSWCFIATAVYGSFSAPEVILLRDFRDQVLTRHVLGGWFITIYYKVSPSLAWFIGSVQPLKYLVRRFLLDPLVRILRKRVSD